MTTKPLPIDSGSDADREQWKQTAYFLIRWTYRTWMACVVLIAVFTALWTLEVVGLITRELLSAIWVGVIVMGLTFLTVLIPVAILSYRASSE